MTQHTLVIPFSTSLLHLVAHNSVVIRVSSIDQLVALQNTLPSAHLRVGAVILEDSIQLSDLVLKDSWQNFSLIIMGGSLGDREMLLDNLNKIRPHNPILMLPASLQDIATDLMMLSSLSIRCGWYFDSGEATFESLTDALYYAMYPKRFHAEIYPFSYVRTMPARINTPIGRVYFDDPERFLWLDSEGRIALDRFSLLTETFTNISLDTLTGANEPPELAESRNAWKEHFLSVDKCSTCPGWKVCYGYRASRCSDACRSFFTEFAEVAGEVANHRNRNRRVQPWQ